MKQEQALVVKDLAKSCNDVLSKLGWEWEPKVGEWYLTPDDEVQCIGNELDLENIPIIIDLNPDYIPILHWEEIEKVLRQFSYRTGIAEFHDPFEYAFTIESDTVKSIQEYSSISRQEAVMRAVIKLGEERK